MGLCWKGLTQLAWAAQILHFPKFFRTKPLLGPVRNPLKLWNTLPDKSIIESWVPDPTRYTNEVIYGECLFLYTQGFGQGYLFELWGGAVGD